MRILTISAVALAMSVSTAALAQNQQNGNQQSANQNQTAKTRSYKQVEDSLKQAGIQDVQVLNASYLVSAVTKQGEQVTFMIDPALVAAGSSASSGSSQSGSSTQQGTSSQQGGNQQAALMSQQQVRDSLTKAGFQSVQILDATYLARGKTQNGDQITMMIDPTATTASSEASGSGSASKQSGGQKQ
jgi:hypothetical protein